MNLMYSLTNVEYFMKCLKYNTKMCSLIFIREDFINLDILLQEHILRCKNIHIISIHNIHIKDYCYFKCFVHFLYCKKRLKIKFVNYLHNNASINKT